MIFDNCRTPISEITDQELKNFIGNQEENQWIEFKRKDYHRDPNDPEKHKREICKDVTAMANAEGGYIFIGVQEKDKIAQGFFTIDNPDKIVESINSVCLESIDPRIQNLEVQTRSLKWNGRNITLVIIHIPPSDLRPHSFVWKNFTHFVKRYGDQIREYPMSELVEAFSARHYPPILGQIHAQLDAILRNTQQNRRSSMSPQEDALEQQRIGDLLHLMKLRFEEVISDEPYYRILTVPTTLNPDAVSTQDQAIHAILRNPPNVRRTGFGFIGVEKIEYSPEGIKGIDVWGYEVVILRNGFIELRRPLSSTHFQHFKIESGFSAGSKWLQPYAVCELPVTFMKLVKAIYSAVGIDSKIIVQQEYRNLNGFLLVGRHPSNPLFGRIEEHQQMYTQSDAIGQKWTIEPEFVPDQAAYDLVKEIYASFGLSEDLIPLFDANHNFVP